MIGTLGTNNDNHIYLETEQELNELATQTIQGTFIRGTIKGKLELSVYGEGVDLAKYKLIKNQKETEVIGLQTSIHKSRYQRLKKSGQIGVHLGFAHVNVTGPNNLQENLGYKSLKAQLQN